MEKIFENFSDFYKNSVNEGKLEKFLDKFPDDAKEWTEAGDELSEIYKEMILIYNSYQNDDNQIENLNTSRSSNPSKHNKKFKSLIMDLYKKFDPKMKKELEKEFKDWF